MDFDLSPKMLAILFIIAGVVLVFILLGGSLQQLFSKYSRACSSQDKTEWYLRSRSFRRYTQVRRKLSLFSRSKLYNLLQTRTAWY